MIFQLSAALFQLFVDQISWFFQDPSGLGEKSIWHQKNLDLNWEGVSWCQLISVASADQKSKQSFGAKLIFYPNLEDPEKISWFDPQTAELEQLTVEKSRNLTKIFGATNAPTKELSAAQVS